MKNKNFLLFIILICVSQISKSQNWSITGNSGVAASNFIGTKDSAALKFRTKNLLRAVFDSTGKFGVGTSAPLVKMDVQDSGTCTMRINSTNGSSVLRIQRPANTGASQIYIRTGSAGVNTWYVGAAAGTNNFNFGYGTASGSNLVLTTGGNIGVGTASPADKLTVLTASNSYGAVSTDGTISIGSYLSTGQGGEFGTKSNHPLNFFTNNNSPQVTLLQNGNLGVGTTVPGARLHIKTTAAEAIRIEGANSYLSFFNGTGNYMGYLQNYNNSLVLGLDASNTVGKLLFNTAQGQAMQIDELNNVSIGTSTAATGYKLSVNGSVICTELKVQLKSNWPDYVFSENHQLMPLYELEKKIKQDNHLPGIPSSCEVEENGGVQVGALQTKLLEKVEELTLYVIQLQKENDELKMKDAEILKLLQNNSIVH